MRLDRLYICYVVKKISYCFFELSKVLIICRTYLFLEIFPETFYKIKVCGVWRQIKKLNFKSRSIFCNIFCPVIFCIIQNNCYIFISVVFGSYFGKKKNCRVFIYSFIFPVDNFLRVETDCSINIDSLAPRIGLYCFIAAF